MNKEEDILRITAHIKSRLTFYSLVYSSKLAMCSDRFYILIGHENTLIIYQSEFRVPVNVFLAEEAVTRLTRNT